MTVTDTVIPRACIQMHFLYAGIYTAGRDLGAYRLHSL